MDSTSDSDYQKLILTSPDCVLNWENEGNGSVPFACFLIIKNEKEALKLLTKQIPEALRQQTNYGESVLYFALKFENYEIARYLLQLERSQTVTYFYGFTKGGQSPLTISCDTFCCPNDIIYKLLENGPVYKQEELKLAMLNAVKTRHIEAIMLLLDHEVSLLNEELDLVTGKYFMHFVFEGQTYQEQIFDHIWERYRNEVDWSVVDKNKTTVFHNAMRSTLHPVKLLSMLEIYSQYFPTNFQDIKGNTLLHLAVAWNDLSVVKYCCEKLNINTRIKNHDNENALKAGVYRASLGQWDLFHDKISYMIERMFKPPYGTFCFEAIADLFNLTSMHRFYQTNTRLYPLLIEACYLDESNSYKNVIQDFINTFDREYFPNECHFISIYLHDKAIVYPEHQSKRREIIYELVDILCHVLYDEQYSFIPVFNVIQCLQKIPGFTIEPYEFCDYSGIHYCSMFYILDIFTIKNPQVCQKIAEFYHVFDKLNIINFDDIVEMNLCKILFQEGKRIEDKRNFVNSEVFRTQLHLSNIVSLPHALPDYLSHIYGTEEFRLIEQFLTQNDFNRVCFGKKVMSLKLICRSVCRGLIMKQDSKGRNRDRVIRKLRLPMVLENFLQYMD